MVVLFGFAPQVKADSTDLSITGNGGNSSNQVNVTTASQTTVQQSNTAAVNTTVNATQNTGNNSASNNSGNTSVTTGNTASQTAVSTTANNSIVDGGCNCSNSTATNITVSGNGSGSQNAANYANTSQTTMVVSNTATITNTITETADTGDNHADNNTGSVVIHTGDISVHNAVSNNINSAKVNGGRSDSDSVSLSVSGNGSGSVNSVHITNGDNRIISITNVSHISNVVSSDLNTGGNTANGNTGVVDITTGNILFDTQINTTANTGSVEETVCKKDPTNDPTTPSTPSVPGSSANPSTPATSTASAGASSASSGTSGISQAATASLGDSLPVTGANWFLFIILGNVLMFFLGAYLRLRSGRSPGFSLGF